MRIFSGAAVPEDDPGDASVAGDVAGLAEFAAVLDEGVLAQLEAINGKLSPTNPSKTSRRLTRIDFHSLNKDQPEISTSKYQAIKPISYLVQSRATVNSEPTEYLHR